jgi:hypothetical protein
VPPFNTVVLLAVPASYWILDAAERHRGADSGAARHYGLGAAARHCGAARGAACGHLLDAATEVEQCGSRLSSRTI